MAKNQFENIKTEWLLKDYDELFDLSCTAFEVGELEKKHELDNYRDTIEKELNSRGWWINHRLGVFTYGDPNA